jgi:hypothetical protein
MQNMISVARGPKTYRVFFDTNMDTKDFENIRVRDEYNEPVLTLHREDITALKDLIAEEIILATMELAAEFKAGTIVRC